VAATVRYGIPRTAQEAGVKAFICTDLEGVAGVVSFAEQTYPGGKYVEQANHLLTAEVTACAQGLFDAAPPTYSSDAHGWRHAFEGSPRRV
jgi:hypothetical protein